MKYGSGRGVDKEVSDCSMKKVMGSSANMNTSQTAGGKIQKPGQYSAKVAPLVETESVNRSGFNGTSAPKPKYQGN